MKVAAIIAEYNPFHQGHAFHLKETRALTGADHVLVVMSGNHVQRGVPAMFDKYTRAQAALQNGADLVLELPPCAATGSAEYFADGAIDLIHKTGVVTDLCFGSECGDLTQLLKPAQILADEPERYRELLRTHLKAGEPYPKARALALSEYDPTISGQILTEPNNLLGIEYLKALSKTNSSIQPHTISRKGSGYHTETLTGIASASGIRRAILTQDGHLTEEITSQLPSAELYAVYNDKTPMTEDAYSLLLLEKLRRVQDEPLTDWFDVTEELSNRIWNCLDDYQSFSQFTDLLKTRNLTRTAVSRALLHILLDIRTFEDPQVVRVLGFCRDAAPLLSDLSQKSMLPVSTSLTQNPVSGEWQYADRLYDSVRSLLHQSPYENEYRRKMLVVS
jgi:predicted nucleotidyltransferase